MRKQLWGCCVRTHTCARKPVSRNPDTLSSTPIYCITTWSVDKKNTIWWRCGQSDSLYRQAERRQRDRIPARVWFFVFCFFLELSCVDSNTKTLLLRDCLKRSYFWVLCDGRSVIGLQTQTKESWIKFHVDQYAFQRHCPCRPWVRVFVLFSFSFFFGEWGWGEGLSFMLI